MQKRQKSKSASAARGPPDSTGALPLDLCIVQLYKVLLKAL